MTEEKSNPLEKSLGNWVIVHEKTPTGKNAEVGKLKNAGKNNIALEQYQGSFEEGCLPNLKTIPYEGNGPNEGQGIYRVYNENLETLYENPAYKI